jgi:ribose 5-phosphate isomerase B
MKIAIANDHAGLELKREVAEGLKALGHSIEDFGTHDDSSVDYPDFASQVARAVRDGQVQMGVLVCGTGIGMSIVANKYRGVRAALCTTELEARMSRAHNDANVLCLGERVVGPGLGRAIAEAFVSTGFEGGRHEKRVRKIAEAEAENDRG